LVGSKSDKHHDREVSSAEGITLAKELNCPFFECSSKSLEEVEQIVAEIVRELRLPQKRANQPPSPQQETVEHASSSQKRRSKLQLFTAFFLRQPRPTGAELRLADLRALNTCLVNASRINDYRAVKKFLSKGADPNGQPGADGAAIHTAAALGHTKIVGLLLKNGAAANAKGPRDVTALQLAAAEGHSSTVQLLLKEGAKVNEVSGLHGTALAAAASRARVEAARILLKNNADPNIQGGPYGNALQAAAYVGNETVVDLLLNEGARVEARGEGDCTALQVACFAGHLAVVRLLLTRGVYIDAPGGKYGSALKAANDHGKAEIVKILLTGGASNTGLLHLSVAQNTDDISTQELANPGEELPLPSQITTELGAPHINISPPPPPTQARIATLRTIELAT
jgi:ankyrin repeat protein